MKIGYPCINLSLDCRTARTFRLASFSKEIFLETVKGNLDCLIKILKWNEENKIKYFRIGSGLIPFASHQVCQIDWPKIFKKEFENIGQYIRSKKMRITMHPSYFVLINSPKKEIVDKSIKDLDYHVKILDLLGLDNSHKIQIHVGGVYKGKETSRERFISNYLKLPQKIKERLVIENDEKSYSIKDCLVIAKKTQIPIVFDCFHHSILNNKETNRKVIKLIKKYWKKEDGLIMIDFSTQDKSKRIGAHAQTIELKKFNDFLKEIKGYPVDIMLEIKDKEKSVLKIKKNNKII